MSKTDSKIVQEVMSDYLKRREERRNLEAQWQLNINFVMGNQYSYISSNGGLREDEKQYFWQFKEENTQRDGMGREEGGGFRMLKPCIPVVEKFGIWQNQ